MKYRTVIELVCEASDKDDASNLAGDYLRGDIDFGVDMRCRTTSLASYKFKKIASTCALTFFIFFLFLFNVTPVGSYIASETGRASFQATSTVMPSLRTRYAEDFRERWEEEKERAVMDYLKYD